MDIFPALPEKLLTEVTAHEGDVFIVPEDLFAAYDDPENFQPLDELPVGKTSPYTAVNQKTGEKQSMPFGLRKGKNS